jgi:hypothetical protein
MGRTSQPRPERPRERLRLFLHARGYRGRPTALAAELKVPLKAAENLLDGHWPADDLKLAAMFSRFGKALYDAVFAPDVDEVLAQLKEREARLEQELAQTRSRLRQAEGRSEGVPDSVAGASKTVSAPSPEGAKAR